MFLEICVIQFQQRLRINFNQPFEVTMARRTPQKTKLENNRAGTRQWLLKVQGISTERSGSLRNRELKYLEIESAYGQK